VRQSLPAHGTLGVRHVRDAPAAQRVAAGQRDGLAQRQAAHRALQQLHGVSDITCALLLCHVGQ